MGTIEQRDTGFRFQAGDLLGHRRWTEVQHTGSGKHTSGIGDRAKDRQPAWNLIGRVNFNLAENRKDAEAPFAFLATYTTQLSAAAKPQHLPLACLPEHPWASPRILEGGHQRLDSGPVAPQPPRGQGVEDVVRDHRRVSAGRSAGAVGGRAEAQRVRPVSPPADRRTAPPDGGAALRGVVTSRGREPLRRRSEPSAGASTPKAEANSWKPYHTSWRPDSGDLTLSS